MKYAYEYTRRRNSKKKMLTLVAPADSRQTIDINTDRLGRRANRQDVRQNIESFLKRTAREVVIPASVGLGLVLAGCQDAPRIVKYACPFPR